MGARRWIAVVAAAPWVAWAVVRTFGLDLFWPLVALVPFTPYAAATAIVPVLVALALQRRVTAAVALVAAIALIVAVVPRALGDGTAKGENARELTVMSSNLLGGRGDARAVMALVRRHDVDVLSLQELSAEAVVRLDAAGARELLPGRAVEARPQGAGSGLMAKGDLVPVDGDSNDVPAQPAADLTTATGPQLRIKAIHPFPPLTRTNSQGWRTELRELPSGDEGDPELRILAGDFNATLDHRELRRLLDRGWTDAADAVGEGLRPTWPVGRFGPPITIDHVLVGPGIGVRSFSTHEIPGSDHRAVIARLTLPPG